MSEKFWVQEADGKLDGSLPGVPKKGYIAGVADKVNAAGVSNVQKVADTNKAKDDNFPTDEQLVEILKMLRKGLRFTRGGNILQKLGIDPAVFTLEEVTALVEMYVQLRKMKLAIKLANVVGINGAVLDKYYHCRAHCIGNRTGLGGMAVTNPAGYAKEVADLFKNAFGLGTITGTFSQRIVASIIDSIGDLAANSTGRLGDPRISCNDVCEPLWPQSVPSDIREQVDKQFGV